MAVDRNYLVRTLTLRYLLAVGLIAVLALASQVFLQVYLWNVGFDSREINLAGKMRMLSQRMVKQAGLLALEPGSDSIREDLHATASELDQILTGLRVGDKGLGLIEAVPEVAALIDTARPTLNVSLAAVSSLLGTQDGQAEFRDAINTLRANDDQLLAEIARIPAALDDLASQKIADLRVAEFVLLALTLIILALEFLLIFRPITRVSLEAIEQTEQIIAEEEQLKGMATLGVMSGGIAHEINSPLASLSFTLQRLRRGLRKGRMPDQTSLSKQVETMERDMLRVQQVSSSVRALAAGKLPEERALVNLGTLFDQALELLDNKGGVKGVEIRIDDTARALQVWCVDFQIVQVLYNLVRNSTDAIASLHAPWIELSAFEHDGRVRITVRDRGTGIAPEVLDKIFDPFFTTKDIGVGMGLGLALTAKFIDLHDGDIRYALVDEHTAFVITLPASEDAAL